MNRTILQSRTLKTARYDEKSQTLEIEFAEGKIARYLEVPISLYFALITSDSVDSFHSTNIRSQYPQEEVVVIVKKT